ncbi:MAG: hypothetical protein EA375_06325 [Acholeplasmataceae bacterium]|nr:MAG: hypothetical protein EA375_06325 [Acholeplasmataceae bacterium]
MAYIPVLFVFIPIMAGLILYIFKHPKVSLIVFLAQLSMVVLFVLYVRHLTLHPQDALLVFGGWDAKFAISFYHDVTSLSFVGLAIFMWLFILMYTFKTNRKESKYLFFLMFLQGVFMGLLQTNDLFNLFVFLELTAVLVTILIVYRKTGTSFRAGIYYLLLNTVGAMFFLIGVILIYYSYGTINIQMIRADIALLSDTRVIKLAFVFMIAGISVKAAIFPVFTWLPRAHGVAQSSISALLSGLIVKGALYMFIRINNHMFADAAYNMQEVFFWLGLVTALIGVFFAISQKDLKQILAYHTISQVGIVMMGLASTHGLSIFGGFLHVFNHALFKGLLFLAAGVIIKTYGSKKVSDVRGVFKTMPWTALLLIVGMLSIAGAPLFNGFVSKTAVKYAFQDDMLKMVLFAIVNLGTITSFIKFSQILFGPKKALTIKGDVLQHLGMTLMALSCLAIGLFHVPLGTWLYPSIDLGGQTLTYIRWYDPMNILEFLIYAGIGYLFYTTVINKDYWPTRKLRDMVITFENANYLFIVYILVLAFFVMI